MKARRAWRCNLPNLPWPGLEANNKGGSPGNRVRVLRPVTWSCQRDETNTNVINLIASPPADTGDRREVALMRSPLYMVLCNVGMFVIGSSLVLVLLAALAWLLGLYH